jgi:integration host factor subunit alpha
LSNELTRTALILWIGDVAPLTRRSSQTGAAGNGSPFSQFCWSLLMTHKSVTRADLDEAVYQQAQVTKEYAANPAGRVLEAGCTTLDKGESVKLSSFEVFTGRTKGQCIGRNLRTNVEVPIEPRRAITFSASPVPKVHVNRALSLSSCSTYESVRLRMGGPRGSEREPDWGIRSSAANESSAGFGLQHSVRSLRPSPIMSEMTLSHISW